MGAVRMRRTPLGCMCVAGMPCQCNRPGKSGIDPPDYTSMTDELDIKEYSIRLWRRERFRPALQLK